MLLMIKHIYKNKGKFEYIMLSLKDYPIGAPYYKHNKDIDRNLIHFNYVICEKTRTNGEWYI
jgi:hypothetical protein